AIFENVDLIPSHLDLIYVDLDLGATVARERRLRKAIDPILSRYDIVVCDCPPNLTIPTQNALAVATHYVVPISPDFLSAVGVGQFLGRIKEIAESLDTSLKLAGIVLSRVGRASEHRAETEASIRAAFKTDVLDQKIKERSSVSKS